MKIFYSTTICKFSVYCTLSVIIDPRRSLQHPFRDVCVSIPGVLGHGNYKAVLWCRILLERDIKLSVIYRGRFTDRFCTIR